MNTFIDRQLAKIKYEEILQEAEEARANRKVRTAHPNPVSLKLKFALAAAMPFVLWMVWAFVKG